MDKEKLMKGCYIHVEMKDGECEQTISGNGLVLALGLCGVIERMAQISNADFEEVFAEIRRMHYSKQEVDKEEE